MRSPLRLLLLLALLLALELAGCLAAVREVLP